MTKYSPLHAACCTGRRDVAELLLRSFPESVNSLTIERWSPLTAACLNGHAAIVDLILRHPYPKDMSERQNPRRAKGPTGPMEYHAPFDLNQVKICNLRKHLK